MQKDMSIEFEQLSSAMKVSSTVLLDVRNLSELKEDGRIPGSVNIPLPEVSAAFRMSLEEFNKKYGFALPDKESESLILTCRSLSLNHVKCWCLFQVWKTCIYGKKTVGGDRLQESQSLWGEFSRLESKGWRCWIITRPVRSGTYELKKRGWQWKK